MPETPRTVGELWVKVCEMDRRYQERFDAQEKALMKADAAQEKRLDTMNEFRGQLKDQSATFISRVEMDAKIEGLEARINANRSTLQVLRGEKQGSSDSWAFYLAATAVAVALFSLAARLFV